MDRGGWRSRIERWYGLFLRSSPILNWGTGGYAGEEKNLTKYTQYAASGTGLVGRYQNFEGLDGTGDIKFPKLMGQ